MDRSQHAALLSPSLMLEASNYGDIIPWTIHEALKSMVAEGAASKTAYAFNSNGDFTEVDLLARNCVADIKAKLLELAAARAVPASLKGFVTPQGAESAYRASIAFIEKHGHAVISNGGFVIDSYDPKNNSMALSAFRDPAYPFERGWFTKTLSSSFARIDRIVVGDYAAGKDLEVSVDVSEVAFPDGHGRALRQGACAGDAGRGQGDYRRRRNRESRERRGDDTGGGPRETQARLLHGHRRGLPRLRGRRGAELRPDRVLAYA